MRLDLSHELGDLKLNILFNAICVVWNDFLTFHHIILIKSPQGLKPVV